MSGSILELQHPEAIPATPLISDKIIFSILIIFFVREWFISHLGSLLGLGMGCVCGCIKLFELLGWRYFIAFIACRCFFVQ